MGGGGKNIRVERRRAECWSPGVKPEKIWTTPKDAQEMFDLGEKVCLARQAFLSRMLLMATGALTLLVSLRTGIGGNAVAIWSLRVVWPTLGLGILSGSIALYDEVRSATSLWTQWVTHIQSTREAPVIIAAAPSKVCEIAGKISYALLSLAVLASG
jgi:hypothetical protein